jgi:hypothetical protein
MEGDKKMIFSFCHPAVAKQTTENSNFYSKLVGNERKGASSLIQMKRKAKPTSQLTYMP